MPINRYDQGDLVRVKGVFTDTDSTPIDPTTVSFKFRNPSGTITTYSHNVHPQLVKDGIGIYHVDIVASISGMFYYRWESAGEGQAAQEGQFMVERSLL